MMAAQTKRLARVRQMLNYVKQHDDVYATNFLQAGLVRQALQHLQSLAAAMCCCIIGQFNAKNLEMAARLLKKESIGATQFQ